MSCESQHNEREGVGNDQHTSSVQASDNLPAITVISIIGPATNITAATIAANALFTRKHVVSIILVFDGQKTLVGSLSPELFLPLFWRETIVTLTVILSSLCHMIPHHVVVN